MIGYWYCLAGSPKYVAAELLLKHGAKVNVADERGVTPLEVCIFHSVISRSPDYDGLSVLRRLVAAGALLHPTAKSGYLLFVFYHLYLYFALLVLSDLNPLLHCSEYR